MYAMFSAMVLKGLDAKGLVDELRDRMRDELDYRSRPATSPSSPPASAATRSSAIPKLVPELSSARVLTTEWVDGMTLDQFRDDRVDADQAARRRGRSGASPRARSSPRGLQRRPAPGQLPVPPRRQRDVPRLRPREALVAGRVGVAAPDLDAIIVRPRSRPARGGDGRVGFLPADHGLDPALVFDYVRSPYVPYLTDEFTFTREFDA